MRGSRTIRANIHKCVRCKHVEAKPKPQLLGKLPLAHLKPGDVFSNTEVDYAGPNYIKSEPVHKPTITKGYVAVFVSHSIKAEHLELVMELTTSSFICMGIQCPQRNTVYYMERQRDEFCWGCEKTKGID